MRFVKCDVCGQVIEPDASIMQFGIFDKIKSVNHGTGDILVYHPLFCGEESKAIELCESCYNSIFREGRTLVDMARTLATEV